MDPDLLQKFRNQLASWIENRLESQRLPFQRLEICPRTLTERGRLTPDIVLWINRDSQLAGSIILLPDRVDDHVLAEGASLAKALGLGHFTTWGAREVVIWKTDREQVIQHSKFLLPPANRVIPQDFQDLLDELLEQLKIVTVTSTPETSQYSAYYFVNLCIRNLQEVAPGLTLSARMTAGQTEADTWVEQAPREKAWLCLWRILFLLWQGRLPPGLQPERLEAAVHYALDELLTTQQAWLAPQSNEPPLPEDDAVRLYHLAGRLRQLGWPHDDNSANDLIWLLLQEAAHRFGLVAHTLPWGTEQYDLRVFCQPTNAADSCFLVAPRAYLAGWTLLSSPGREVSQNNLCAETILALDGSQRWDTTTAALQDEHQPDRNEREKRLLRLRQVWPNRRFELPRDTPAWVWDALHLTGLTYTELALILPDGWHLSKGVTELWEVISERWQVNELSIHTDGLQSIKFMRKGGKMLPCFIHREGQRLELPGTIQADQEPGTIQVWLKAAPEMVSFLAKTTKCGFESDQPEDAESLQEGASLYLQTDLGRYLWKLCTGDAPQPDTGSALDDIATYGIPRPDETTLSDLASVVGLGRLNTPETDIINQEFIALFGQVPEIPSTGTTFPTGKLRTQRKGPAPYKKIMDRIFLDGVPLFPEHYLMHIYRPELTSYELDGPLQIAEEFFDCVVLQSTESDLTLEVSGKTVAEALMLASYGGNKSVSLPSDEQLLVELLTRYRNDLVKLWDKLTRECRSVAPQRQAAIKLARKIWREKGLPPEHTFAV